MQGNFMLSTVVGFFAFLKENNFQNNMQLTSVTHFNHFMSKISSASPPGNSGNLMFLFKKNMPGYNCNWCKPLKEEGVQSQTVKHMNEYTQRYS